MKAPFLIVLSCALTFGSANDTVDIRSHRAFQDSLLAGGDTLQVRTRYLDRAKKETDNPAVLYLTGRCLPCSTGEALFKKALEKKPKHAWSQNGLGACAFERGDFKAARGFFLLALKSDPSLSDSYRNLARTYMAEGSKDKATRVFRRLIDRNRLSPEAYDILGDHFLELNRFSEALKAYKTAQNIDKSRNMKRLFKSGFAAFRLGKTAEAAAHYKKSLEAGNETFELYFNLASALEQSRSFEDALTYYRKANELNGDVRALFSMGNCAFMLGLHSRAIECYRGVLAKEPGNAEAMFGLANAYQIKRDFDAAVETFNKVLVVDSTFSKAWFNLGSLYAYHLKDTEKARRYWAEYVRRFPDSTDTPFVKREMAALDKRN